MQSVVTAFFTYLSNAWLIVSIVLVIIDRRYGISDLWKGWFRKPSDLSFQNDCFAEDTIRYRFRNTLYDLNNCYEDWVFSRNIKEFNRPFDFDKFYSEPFYIPEYSRLAKNKCDEQLLSNFYDKYSCYTSNKEFMENAPFIDVEHAFYFYILDKLKASLPTEAQRYMCDGTEGEFDPYKLQKKKSIQKDIKRGIREIAGESSRILKGLDAVYKLSNNILEDGCNKMDLTEDLIVQSLNTNSYDLSQLRGMDWHETSKEKELIRGAREFLDYLYLTKRGIKRTINYLVDNAGVEFFSDLVLGYALLSNSEMRIDKIIYHVNVLPIFVSDVIESDLEYTFKIVRESIMADASLDKEKYLSALKLLEQMFDKDHPLAEIKPDFIWNMPTPYETIERGKNVYQSSNDILIVKGDLNFRRLCHDKSWHYSKKLNDLTKYIKSPTLVVRSFKSNVILDFSRDKVKQLTIKDRDWKTNGKYGVILFMKKEG